MDEIIYVEEPPRNADHRTGTPVVVSRPGAPRPTTAVVASRASYAPSPYAPSPYAANPYAANPYAANPYAAPPFGVYPPGHPWAGQPVNPYAPAYDQHPLSNLFGQYGSQYGRHGERKIIGNLTMGGAVDLAAEAIAALWPLPASPSGTGDVATDVQNHLLYQTSLANHTKRDERIRTLGVVMKRLIG